MSRRARHVLKWAEATFGAVATDPAERAMRFVEEAIEVAHAIGLEPERVRAIVDRVYSREQGTLPREIGQAQITLETFAENIGVNADLEANKEFARIQAIPREEWARRHAAKVQLGIAK